MTQHVPAPPFDVREFRRTLGCFVTGVTVVTAEAEDGERRGFTANSFTSVSLDPPLILVCIGRGSTSLPLFSRVDRFAVNILADDQRAVSGAFASKGEDKFRGIDWSPGPFGSPILSGAAAWLECAVHDRIEAGDHILLIGRVLAFEHTARTPLGYHGGNYVSFDLERRAVAAAHGPIDIGGIFEADGSVLLFRDGAGWRLPTGRTLGEAKREPGSLFEALDAVGVTAAVTFVFSVGHDRAANAMHLYYRGEVLEGPPPDHPIARLVPFDEVRLDLLPTKPNHRIMVERYMRERLEDRFGIYVGSTEGGTIRPLADG